MPEWLFDFLSGPTIKIAAAIWNSSMKLIIKLVCSTPQKFSTGTWAFVKENLYPWAEGIGLSALNLFFMIAFLKAVSNLHQNITLEMVIEAMIKVVVANVLYLNILNIMTTIFSISSAMAKEVFTIDAPDLKVEDMDIGSALFYQLFGLLFILAAIVCSFLMLWTVYSRYIKLYLLMILAPFAMSALVGGQEIERSFYAWMRTFLLNAFEIVVIALTIKKGIFLNITMEDLPEKKKQHKKKKVKVQKRVQAGDSISQRPEHIDFREEFGHWEMDTVVGPQGKSKKVMLVLTERKTRKEIVYLMPDRKAQTVVKTLNMIERKYGERLFRDVFKTITVDNGVEFSDAEGLEKSRRNKKKRTKVYYCHPYSSCERGSNENANRLIRRHIPKGVNFDKKSKTEIKEIETWINNYPRKIFEYDTAENQFINEMEKLTG